MTNHTATDAEALEYALAYARLGWPVVPLHYVMEDGRCSCGDPHDGRGRLSRNSVGKHPNTELAPRGALDATIDEDVIRAWFTGRRCNVAIVCGHPLPDGGVLGMVDIDPRNGGDDSWSAICEQHGYTPNTVTQLTGGGGLHLAYRVPEGFRLRWPKDAGPGVDVKNRGGYIVAEPSNHASGRTYRWEASSSPLEGAELEAAPAWMLEPIATVDTREASAVGEAVGYVPPTLRRDLSEALKYLDPDPRDTWLNVGAALHSTGDPEMFDVWCEWSARSPKYSLQANRELWRWFDKDKRARPRRHIESIFHDALKARWTGSAPGDLETLATIDALRASDRARKASTGKAGAEAGSADSSTGAAGAADGVILRCAAAVQPEPVSWLWPGWIAERKLHILAGPPGSGKTTLALALAATVTRGACWPCGATAPRGSVLIWSGEDGVEDTLVPRLIGAGADVSKVHILHATRRNGRTLPFQPAADLPLLVGAARQIGDVRMIVIDPLVSMITRDSHKGAETRADLQPLVDFAAGIGAASIGIHHLTKGSVDRDPVERLTGTIAFGALARVVLMAMKHHDGGRLLIRAKCNLGPDGGGWNYEVPVVRIDGDIETTRAEFGDFIEGEARSLMREADGVGEREPDRATQQQAAAEWLKQLLAKGPRSQKDVEAAARLGGHAWRTIERAKRAAGAVSRKTPTGWLWELEPAPEA